MVAFAGLSQNYFAATLRAFNPWIPYAPCLALAYFESRARRALRFLNIYVHVVNCMDCLHIKWAFDPVPVPVCVFYVKYCTSICICLYAHISVCGQRPAWHALPGLAGGRLVWLPGTHKSARHANRSRIFMHIWIYKTQITTKPNRPATQTDLSPAKWNKIKLTATARWAVWYRSELIRLSRTLRWTASLLNDAVQWAVTCTTYTVIHDLSNWATEPVLEPVLVLLNHYFAATLLMELVQDSSSKADWWVSHVVDLLNSIICA